MFINPIAAEDIVLLSNGLAVDVHRFFKIRVSCGPIEN
jgi:hypothetical protein